MANGRWQMANGKWQMANELAISDQPSAMTGF
jgi:hypothetical protein